MEFHFFEIPYHFVMKVLVQGRLIAKSITSIGLFKTKFSSIQQTNNRIEKGDLTVIYCVKKYHKDVVMIA